MADNDIVGIRKVSLLVVIHLLIRCRPSSHQGKKTEIMVFQDSSQQGEKWKLLYFMPLLCILIIFARVQHSDRWSYLNLYSTRAKRLKINISPHFYDVCHDIFYFKIIKKRLISWSYRGHDPGR